MARTIQQRANNDGFPKPLELIEVRAGQELTLQSRRVFNALVENAWDEIDQPINHRILVKTLRGRHKGKERVEDSLSQLMRVQVKITGMLDGRLAEKRLPLIASTNKHIDESRDDAFVEYEFHQDVRRMIKNSGSWGRIKSHICYAFSSKYAIALYELVCARINREHTSQAFDVDDFRELLGVRSSAYKGYPQLKQRVLEPALLEVNGLSDVNAEITAIRHGGFERGRLIGFRLAWSKKNADEWMKVTDELMRPKVGRAARLRGEVAEIASELGSKPPPIRYVSGETS